MTKYRVKEHRGMFTAQILLEKDDVKTMIFGKRLRKILFGEHVPKFYWLELPGRFKSFDEAKELIETIKENTRLADVPPIYHEID